MFLDLEDATENLTDEEIYAKFIWDKFKKQKEV